MGRVVPKNHINRRQNLTNLIPLWVSKVSLCPIHRFFSSYIFRWCSKWDRPKRRQLLRLDAPASAAPAPGVRATPSRTRRATGNWWHQAGSCDVPLYRDPLGFPQWVAPPRGSAPWGDQLDTARPDAPRMQRPRTWRWLRCRCTGLSKILLYDPQWVQFKISGKIWEQEQCCWRSKLFKVQIGAFVTLKNWLGLSRDFSCAQPLKTRSETYMTLFLRLGTVAGWCRRNFHSRRTNDHPVYRRPRFWESRCTAGGGQRKPPARTCHIKYFTFSKCLLLSFFFCSGSARYLNTWMIMNVSVNLHQLPTNLLHSSCDDVAESFCSIVHCCCPLEILSHRILYFITSYTLFYHFVCAGIILWDTKDGGER